MHHVLQRLSLRPHLALLLAALSLAAATPGRAAAQSKVVEVTGTIGTRHNSGAMAFSPDGKTLALAGTGDVSVVELWSLKTGKARILRSSFNNEHLPSILDAEHEPHLVTDLNLAGGEISELKHDVGAVGEFDIAIDIGR